MVGMNRREIIAGIGVSSIAAAMPIMALAAPQVYPSLGSKFMMGIDGGGRDIRMGFTIVRIEFSVTPETNGFNGREWVSFVKQVHF